MMLRMYVQRNISNKNFMMYRIDFAKNTSYMPIRIPEKCFMMCKINCTNNTARFKMYMPIRISDKYLMLYCFNFSKNTCICKEICLINILFYIV